MRSLGYLVVGLGEWGAGLGLGLGFLVSRALHVSEHRELGHKELLMLTSF